MSSTSKGLAVTLAPKEESAQTIRKVNRELQQGGPSRLTDLGLLCDKGYM
jgi:hypothetical protein